MEQEVLDKTLMNQLNMHMINSHNMNNVIESNSDSFSKFVYVQKNIKVKNKTFSNYVEVDFKTFGNNYVKYFISIKNFVTIWCL